MDVDVVQEVLVWVKHSFNRGLLVVTIVATYCIAVVPTLGSMIPTHTK